MNIKNYLNLNNLLKAVIIQKKNVGLSTKNEVLTKIIKITMLQNGYFIDQTAIDFIKKEKIIYQFNNKKNRTVIITTAKNSIIESIQPIIKGAFVTEREIFEFFGIFFNNSHDLRRLLTDYSLIGNPLKKIFPVIGFSEIHYSTYKTLIHQKINFAQDVRLFEKKSSWQIKI